MDYNLNRRKAFVDTEIIKLNDDERMRFYETYLQRKKSKIVYLILTFFLYGFGGPVFYIGFKYFEPFEYIYLIVRLFAIYIIVTMFFMAIKGYSLSFVLFTFIILILFTIFDIYMRIRFFSKCEDVVERRNYEEKEKILYYNNQIRFGGNHETF